LDLTLTKITVNEPVTPDHFQLQPPEGVEVVHLTDTPEDKKP